MQSNAIKCIKRVGEKVVCPKCDGLCIKYGKNKIGTQRYHCCVCNKTFLGDYRNKACEHYTNQYIVSLIKEGCGIRSIARLLGIATNTVLSRLLQIARSITRPNISIGEEYEMDELCTYVKKKTKLVWIAYAIRRDNKEVIDFSIGARTNSTLKRVTDTLLLADAKKIYTDKLQQYNYLLPRGIHATKQYSINHIERKNLSIRTHLKRLNRRTICFSKSVILLSACLKIYFWG